MEETKTQLLAIVNNLSDDAVKQSLADKINSAEISEELIQEIVVEVQKSITAYEAKMVEELENADKQIDAVLEEYKRSVKAIVKDSSQKQDQTEIEDIRKKLQ
jgi:exonuclease VII small subunit